MKRKFSVWKLLGGLVSLILIAFAVVCILVYINRDKIAAQVKEEINKSINGHFDFDRVGISLRHFPSLGLCLENFSLVGADPFAGDTLVSGEGFDIAIALPSLLRSSEQIKIQNVTLQSPLVQILVLEDGTANYNIAKTASDSLSTGDTSSVVFRISLESYALENATVIYDDRSVDMRIAIAGLDHKGSGNFTESVFDLEMRSSARALDVSYGGFTYLKQVAVDVDNILEVNLEDGTYSFQEAMLKLNALDIRLDGEVKLADVVTYQIAFVAPNNQFRDLFSVLPNAYTSDFAKMRASGTFSLEGSLDQGENTDLPAFQVSLAVTDGSFQYPDLPLGMRAIQLDASVANPGTNTDATSVDVRRLNWNLDGKPFAARFTLRNPVSDPAFDGTVKGSVDLSALSRAYPMEGVETLSGLLEVDAAGKGRMSQIESKDYGGMSLKADLNARDVIYRAEGSPELRIEVASVQAVPESITIEAFRGSYGESDIDLTGKLDQGILLISGQGPVTGKLTARSRKLDVNPFLQTSAAVTPEQGTGETGPVQAVDPTYTNLDLALEARVDTFVYDTYTLYNSTASGRIKGEQVQISSLVTTYDGQQIRGSGQLDNVWGYAFSSGNLNGDFDVETASLNLNPFLSVEEGETGEAPAESGSEDIFIVPQTYNLTIRAKAGKVQFQDLEMDGITTTISIHDGIAELKDLKTRLLGGALGLNGKYDTRDASQPVVHFNYAIEGFDFQKTFNALNSFAALAPIAKFIEGRFTSNLEFSAKLNSNLSPILGSIDAEGLMKTSKSEIRNFPPLEKAASLMQMQFLNNVPLEDTWNKFRVIEGTVFVDPFDIKYQDVSMKVSGSHNLETGMDYNLQMELPYNRIRDKIGAGQALASVSEQARKLGIDLREGVRVNLLVNLKGTIKDPRVTFKVLSDFEESILDKAKAQIDAKVDSLKQVAKEKVDSVKTVVKETVDKKKQEIVQQVNQEITTLKAQAQATASQIRSEAQRLADQVKTEGYTQADNLVEAAGDDPLKKLAAKKASDKMKKETDKRVEQILQKADAEAQAVINRAEARADSLRQSLE